MPLITEPGTTIRLTLHENGPHGRQVTSVDAIVPTDDYAHVELGTPEDITDPYVGVWIDGEAHLFLTVGRDMTAGNIAIVTLPIEVTITSI